jgi:3-oxoacyl-[acyl-carrier-protein] synthase-3
MSAPIRGQEAPYVTHLSHALGDQSASVEEAEAAGRLVSGAAAIRDAGFDRHHVASPAVSAYELARRAVSPIAGDLGDVGAIVYVTCLPGSGSLCGPEQFADTRDVKHLMDFPASHLQADFGLLRASIFGLAQQACAGMLGSLRLARSLLLAEPEMERVLCVTADRFPEGALYEQADNLTSDGATACVVSREPAGFRLRAFHALSNGALARVSDDEAAGSFFVYGHRTIVECVGRAGLSLADVDWIVPQNMNHRAWAILARLLGYPMERVLTPSLADVGHVVCGDNLINLERLQAAGRFTRGDTILLFMAGYGLNWQCALLEAA